MIADDEELTHVLEEEAARAARAAAIHDDVMRNSRRRLAAWRERVERAESMARHPAGKRERGSGMVEYALLVSTVGGLTVGWVAFMAHLMGAWLS